MSWIDNSKLANFRTADNKVLLLVAAQDDGTPGFNAGQPAGFKYPLSTPAAVTAGTWSSDPDTTGLLGVAWGIGHPGLITAGTKTPIMGPSYKENPDDPDGEPIFDKMIIVGYDPNIWLVLAVDSIVAYRNGEGAKAQSGEVRYVGTASGARDYLIAEGAPPTNNYYHSPVFCGGTPAYPYGPNVPPDDMLTWMLIA